VKPGGNRCPGGKCGHEACGDSSHADPGKAAGRVAGKAAGNDTVRRKNNRWLRNIFSTPGKTASKIAGDRRSYMGEKYILKKKRNEYFFLETRIFNEASFIIYMQPGYRKFRCLFVLKNEWSWMQPLCRNYKC
jgi:hypothetical protein